MQRKISWLLALCLALGLQLKAFAQEAFRDLDQGRWAHQAVPDRPAREVAEGETVDRLAVNGQDVQVAGRVEGDVLVVNGSLHLRKGAKVGGSVVVVGGNVKNEEAGKIKVVLLGRDMLDALPQGGRFNSHVTLSIGETPPPTPAPPAAAPAARPQGDDGFGGQLALLLLGLLGAGVLRFAAPRASEQVTATLSLETARSFVVGLLAAFGLAFASVFNAAVLHTPLRIVWSPLGFVIGSVVVFLLACGWVYGMRLAGDWVARRAGRHDSGTLFGRIALGMGAFFLANALLNGASSFLGGVGFLAQSLVAVAGLGAIVLTGFGRDPDWLSQRLRGDAGWFRPRR